ncbi:MAG: phosphatidate cytidylyltransferase [Actinomycetota bacterium]
MAGTAPEGSEGAAFDRTPEAAWSRGRSLFQAVGTALVLLGLLALSYALGTNAFFILICVVVLVALFEAFDGLRQAGHLPVTPIGLAAGAGMLVAVFLKRPAWLLVVLAATVYGAFTAALRPGRGRSASSDAAWTLLAVAWIAGGGAAATAILVLDAGRSLLVAFVLVAALDDIGAYFVGTRFGRHKVAPSISPGKSWEGLFGGTVLALLGGLVVGALFDDLGAVEGLGLASVCALLVPVGDLVESLFKREIGVKDSGRLLPGHGGFLDRLDAIIFCAPAAYLYLRLFTT